MATVSDRARESAVEMMHATRANYDIKNDLVTLEASIDTFARFIEQALLTERRLARTETLEEAAKMCDEEAATVDHVARCASDVAAYLGMSERLKIAAFKYMGSVLRTAAEKEGL